MMKKVDYHRMPDIVNKNKLTIKTKLNIMRVQGKPCDDIVIERDNCRKKKAQLMNCL